MPELWEEQRLEKRKNTTEEGQLGRDEAKVQLWSPPCCGEGRRAPSRSCVGLWGPGSSVPDTLASADAVPPAVAALPSQGLPGPSGPLSGHPQGCVCHAAGMSWW